MTDDTLKAILEKSPNEPEFHQAVSEVYDSLKPVFEKRPEYVEAKIFERAAEPERIVSFRVPWTDDNGEVQVNRGFRVEFNSALGPYKGGLRFHRTVNQGMLKFLGFEQVFKNALTGLPMGGGKGGSDFDPHGKSDNEVMRFCQSFMDELYRHIGPDTDVPAGDIGVGAREVGFMFGQYKRLTNSFTGVFTGKGLNWGGSLVRTEATGYGLMYLMEEMLKTKGEKIEGKTVVSSGAGNVSIFCAQKCMEMGAKVVAMSDSNGYVYDPEGIDLNTVKEIKLKRRGRMREYHKECKHAEYHEDGNIWDVKCDLALPNATQNELDGKSAKMLIDNGVMAVGEGANMPCTPEAIDAWHKNGVLYAPGKAANAGGVAVSGLEMSQNSMRTYWTFDKADQKLRDIMQHIHKLSSTAAQEYDGTFMDGANIAGFEKVADSMMDQGLV